MSETAVLLTLKKGRATARVEGVRVTFSAHLCFRFDDSAEDVACLRALGTHLNTLPALVLYGAGKFLGYLLKHAPELKARAAIASTLDEIPPSAKNIFLCETLTVARVQMRRHLPPSVTVIEPAVLAEIAPEIVPARAWT